MRSGITDECRAAWLALGRGAAHAKIEYAYAPPGFSMIGAAIAGTDHYPGFCTFFCSQIDHDMGYSRIVRRGVRACPKQQIAWPKVIQFKCARISAQDGAECPEFPQPDVLTAGIARYVGESIRLEYVGNEA